MSDTLLVGRGPFLVQPGRSIIPCRFGPTLCLQSLAYLDLFLGLQLNVAPLLLVPVVSLLEALHRVLHHTSTLRKHLSIHLLTQ